MNRARIISGFWLAGSAATFILLVLDWARALPLELTRWEYFTGVPSAFLGMISGVLLWRGKAQGWFLLLFLLAYSFVDSAISAVASVEYGLGYVGISWLIVCGFLFHLNHPDVRRFVELAPPTWPRQGFTSGAIRALVPIALCFVLVGLGLGWQIAGIFLFASLSREIYRVSRYGIQSTGA